MNGTNVQIDSKADSIVVLRARLSSFTRETRKAAVWVLENHHEAAVMSLRAIAKEAVVHPNTVTRLTRELGYDSFKGFQQSLHRGRPSVVASFPDRAAWLQNLQDQGGRTQLFADLARDSTTNVETLFCELQPDQLEQAAHQIISARRCFVLGVGIARSLAENCAYMLSMAIPNVRAIPIAGELPVDALARVDQRDIVLAMTFKPYRAEVVEAVAIAQEQGAKIIALSDSQASPILYRAAHEFIVPTETPQFFTSTIALAAFIETLVAFVIANAGSEAIANIKQFHERRHELGIYWEKNNGKHRSETN